MAQANFDSRRHSPLYAALAPHSFSLAMAAPSLGALSFAQTMLSATKGCSRTAVPKPQSPLTRAARRGLN